MNEIYLYLEKELSPAEYKRVEHHIEICSRCKKVVEEREHLLLAAESLHLWETPPDFTRQVMAKIFPERVPFRSWLVAMSVGLSSIVFILFSLFLFSGHNLAHVLINLHQTLIPHLRNISIFIVKLFKMASLALKVIFQLVNFLIKSIANLTTILSPEVQIILISLTFIISTLVFFGVRRKILTGEKI
jgi:hypothetical protein